MSLDFYYPQYGHLENRNAPVTYITDWKGIRRMIRYNNNTFYKMRAYGYHVYWNCTQHSITKCSARLKTRDGILVNVSGDHNHPSIEMKPGYRYVN